MKQNTKDAIGLGTQLVLGFLQLIGLKKPKPGKDWQPIELKGEPENTPKQ